MALNRNGHGINGNLQRMTDVGKTAPMHENDGTKIANILKKIMLLFYTYNLLPTSTVWT